MTLNRISLWTIIALLSILWAGCTEETNIPAQKYHLGSKNHPLDTITISWKSSSDEDIISWGYTNQLEAGDFPSQVKNGDVRFFDIEELAPSSTIFYSILDNEKSIQSELFSFNVGTESSNKFSFCFGGDSQDNYDTWETMSNLIEDSDFFLFLGDLIQKKGSNGHLNEWFECGSQFLSKRVIYYAIGNHDLSSTFRDLFDHPDNGEENYYSFEYKNSIFICLDSEEPGDSEQLEFLENQLDLYNDKTWKFVFFHKPFFTEGSHSNEMQPYLDTWWNAFDNYGVDVIMNGHVHNYTRSKPLNLNVLNNEGLPLAEEYGSDPDMGRMQIISGGLGGDLNNNPGTEWFVDTLVSQHHYSKIEINGNQLILKVKDINGNLIDHLELIKSNDLAIR